MILRDSMILYCCSRNLFSEAIPVDFTSYSSFLTRKLRLQDLLLFRSCIFASTSFITSFSNMQRALTSTARASVRSGSTASKLRPITSAGFNAQQLRFAHKVCLCRCIFVGSGRSAVNSQAFCTNKCGMIRSSNSVLKAELHSFRESKLWQRQWPPR